MKVQLFVPPQGYVAQRWEEGGSMPPLGVLYLAAVLETKGVEVDVVPADALQLSWKQIEQRIGDFDPQIVGVTTTTENRFDSFKLASAAKVVNPNILTVLGGPHISMAREDTLLHVPDVDVAAIGEGEGTLSDIVDSLSSDGNLDRVKGIFVRREGNPVFTGSRDRIEDLDSLPLPARHLIPMEKYRFFIQMPDGSRMRAQNIMTSRGCPFECYFCATPVNWGRKMRGISPERVVDEIEHLIDEYGAEFIWFYDDTLNYNLNRLHRILDLILERKFNIKFCNEFRIDVVDKPLLEKMVRAGLVWGHFGIEAGNPRIRRDIVQKKFDIQKAYQFVEWAGELGFTPNAFLIYSHDTETIGEARETLEIIDRMRAINPDTQIATSILHIYPGTPLEKIAKDKGMMPADFSWSRKRDMKKVVVLPAAQGNVPIFKDRLSWFQLADLVMKRSTDAGNMMSWSKVKSTIKSVTSLRVFLIYSVFVLALFKNKFLRIWKRNKTEIPKERIRIG